MREVHQFQLVHRPACVHTDRVQRQIIAGLAKLALDTTSTMTRSMDEFALATVPPSHWPPAPKWGELLDEASSGAKFDYFSPCESFVHFQIDWLHLGGRRQAHITWSRLHFLRISHDQSRKRHPPVAPNSNFDWRLMLLSQVESGLSCFFMENGRSQAKGHGLKRLTRFSQSDGTMNR